MSGMVFVPGLILIVFYGQYRSVYLTSDVFVLHLERWNHRGNNMNKKPSGSPFSAHSYPAHKSPFSARFLGLSFSIYLRE